MIDGFWGPSSIATPPLTPDWRWRYCLSRIDRLESSGAPEIFFDGPFAAELLSDPVMTDYLYPYLRFRLGFGNTSSLAGEVATAIDKAMEAANEWAITSHSWSLRLEAGVLARRPPGEAIHLEDGGLSRLCQLVYERMFFDVRPWLDFPQTCAAILFSNTGRVAERGVWDLEGKVVAYTLGFGEFEKWRQGTPSRAAKPLCRNVGYDLLYLDGLRLLGLDRPDDLSVVLGRRFEAAVPRMPEVTVDGLGVTYSPDQINALLELTPLGEG